MADYTEDYSDTLVLKGVVTRHIDLTGTLFFVPFKKVTIPTSRSDRPTIHFSGTQVLKASLRTDRHVISGVVVVDGVPAFRHVYAFDRQRMVLIGSTTSHPDTGEWEIKGLEEYAERQIMVIAFEDDINGTTNAQVLDYISQGANE